MSEAEQNVASKIDYEDFKKVEIRIGEIMSAEPVSGSEKLLRLVVRFGDEERQILSGIAKQVPAESIVGRKLPFVTNLKPRSMMGLESNGMILAVTDADQNFSLLEVKPEIASGSQVS